MLKRKHTVFVVLAIVSCLLGTLFYNTITKAQTVPKPYDPWVDVDDNGEIDIMDILELGVRFGETGTPINKTELLCCLTRGNISVPAAAFVPVNRTYELYGYNYIENHEDDYVVCIAPVQLPDGATVTNFTTYWWDVGMGDIGCVLTSYYATQIYRDMAWASSSGTAGYGSSYSEYGIEYATVDNGIYAYIVEIYIPASVSHHDYKFYYAIIEWEYPTLP